MLFFVVVFPFFYHKLLLFLGCVQRWGLEFVVNCPKFDWDLKPHFTCLFSFSILFLKLARVSNTNFLRTFSWLGSKGFNPLYNIHAFNDLSKNNMFSIQPRCFGGTNKKLGPVGVASGVGHWQDSGSSVPQLKILILKLPIPVNGFAPSSVMLGEITALAHEVRNDTVEDWAFESEPLFTSTKGTEIFGGPGDNISPQLYNNLTNRWTTGSNIEKNSRTSLQSLWDGCHDWSPDRRDGRCDGWFDDRCDDWCDLWWFCVGRHTEFEMQICDHSFKALANLRNFWPLPSSVGSFLLLSVGNFHWNLTPPPSKLRTS